MSSQSKPSSPQAGHQNDEIADDALDSVSGGQGSQVVQKMDTIVITASRGSATTASVQKMDPIVVTAAKLPPDLNGTQIASANVQNRKGS
jgi:hypothetical protein